MSNSLQLLRMLEPAVRPGGLQGPARATSAPIESRSFESLLEEAKTIAATETATTNDTAKPAANDPLKALSRVDLIDNAALLRIMGTNRPAPPPLPSDL